MSESVELLFRVKGSGPEPYLLRVAIDGTTLRMACNCMAGARGNWCKHKAAILAGETEQLADLNLQDAATLARLLPETSAVVLAKELAAAERDLQAAERRVKLCKTALAKAVSGH